MKQIILCTVFITGFVYILNGQELFPHSEPASNISKSVFGIRLSNEVFKETTLFRSQQTLRLMYGITAKWMISGSVNFSNRYNETFSPSFINSDGKTTNGIKKGEQYQYKSSCLNLNIKYRFLSIDREKQHFRMSAYLERADDGSAQGTAEPSLMNGNSGTGGGLTATCLKKRIALSATLGGIVPRPYNSIKNDSAIVIKYGRAVNYSLSVGLLCLPVKYKNYGQTNVNVYLEFIGKSYQKVAIYNNGESIMTSNFPSLQKGNYLELRPSVQFIFNSNLRMDFSIATPFINRSYLHDYPVYYITIQRNLYID